MRLDDAGPRTWLLGTTAGWAVAAYLLALIGMGGQVTPLDDDPSLIKDLPPVTAAAASRLGPFEQYSETYTRPLFAMDRQPKNFSLQEGGDAPGAGAFDYLLTSVMITPSLQMAILQTPDAAKSLRVKVGEAPETHPAWRLSSLSPRGAVFDGPEGQKVLELRVFSGDGGQAPTAIAAGPDGDMRNDPNQPIVMDGGGAPKGDAPPPPPPMPAPSPMAGNPTADVPPPAGDGVQAKADPPMTEQAQMEAIRQRIQARRAQLRQQQQQENPTP